ncbi:MAG: hypothetical protein Q9194_003525, partial [Teloschistes cf. exilis]
MRIATLQFAPKLGCVEENVARADSLLASSTAPLENLDLLVLPELTFTGTLIVLYLASLCPFSFTDQSKKDTTTPPSPPFYPSSNLPPPGLQHNGPSAPPAVSTVSSP